MARTTVLESIHGLTKRRPQFKTAQMARDGIYQVYTAPCGCENRTYVEEGHGPSCDGQTNLCDAHAIQDDWDD